MKFDISIPDELLDKHLADTVDDNTETPELDADIELPADDEEETSEEPSEEAADTDDVDAGDDDPAEKVEDEDEDLDTETSDEPDEESFLPEFDRKEIEKDPRLKAAYKHMQSAFTKKMQSVSQTQRENESIKQEFEEFVSELSSDEGLQDFLIEISMRRPQVFESVFERVRDLTEDEDEKRSYLRERDIKRREKEIERRERMSQAEVQQQRTQEIRATTQKVASRLGMTDAETTIAERYVALQMWENRAAGREDLISADEIVTAVKRASKDIAREKERIRKEAELDTQRRVREEVKAKAKAAKRPPAPKSSASPGARNRKRAEPPPGVDRVDWALDQAFSALD